ncbi:MAG TPA: hypothetical protein VM689_00895 [Aliidongia sp.]|nr:hypothetical protein [Aliidongia sp.]
MTPSTRFALEPLAGDETAEARLVADGRQTAVTLPGRCLEAQYALERGEFLLFLTHDVPYEEGLEICLLGSDLRLIDRITIVWPYATGHFREPAIRSKHSLSFRFMGDHRWVVEVLSSPRLHLPFLSDPRGAWRPFRLWTRLILRAGG